MEHDNLPDAVTLRMRVLREIAKFYPRASAVKYLRLEVFTGRDDIVEIDPLVSFHYLQNVQEVLESERVQEFIVYANSVHEVNYKFVAKAPLIQHTGVIITLDV